jgi:hypothetical protein
MNTIKTFSTIGFVCIIAATLSAGEKTISKKDVPEAVIKAFNDTYPNGSVKRYAKEKENGETFYEIESIEGSISRDLLFSPDGNIEEIEERISIDSIPNAIRVSLSVNYRNNKIISAEKTTSGKTITYGVIIRVKNRKREIVYNSDGSVAK